MNMTKEFEHIRQLAKAGMDGGQGKDLALTKIYEYSKAMVRAEGSKDEAARATDSGSQGVPDKEQLKAACTDFFYWWYSAPGNNTQQGFDEWFREVGFSHFTSPGNGWVNDVVAERQRQDQKWGAPEHDDRKSPIDFVQHIEDYAGWARVMAGMGSFEKYRRRMVQVAALAGAAIEASDRALKRAEPPTGESK